MNLPIVSRDEVAQRLAVSPQILLASESRGLIRATRQGEVEGYFPSEIRRLWTVVSLHRDAGINLAGIEAILHLQDQLDRVCQRLHRLAEQLDEALDEARWDED